LPVNTTFNLWDRGSNVKSLQEYLGVKSDGIFGPITQAAQNAYLQAKNTNPIASAPNPYSTQPKPLSAEAIKAIGQKRLLADEAFQRAKERETSGSLRFQASFEAGKALLNREMESASDRLARQLAGRGLARAPMFAGRGQVEIGKKFDDQIGQMKVTLANEIEALKQATLDAQIERRRILADIELEEALLRSVPTDYVTRGA
jgi:hypothetical protein